MCLGGKKLGKREKQEQLKAVRVDENLLGEWYCCMEMKEEEAICGLLQHPTMDAEMVPYSKTMISWPCHQ